MNTDNVIPVPLDVVPGALRIAEHLQQALDEFCAYAATDDYIGRNMPLNEKETLLFQKMAINCGVPRPLVEAICALSKERADGIADMRLRMLRMIEDLRQRPIASLIDATRAGLFHSTWISSLDKS